MSNGASLATAPLGPAPKAPAKAPLTMAFHKFFAAADMQAKLQTIGYAPLPAEIQAKVTTAMQRTAGTALFDQALRQSRTCAAWCAPGFARALQATVWPSLLRSQSMNERTSSTWYCDRRGPG
jgi:hypothetical protein